MTKQYQNEVSSVAFQWCRCSSQSIVVHHFYSQLVLPPYTVKIRGGRHSTTHGEGSSRWALVLPPNTIKIRGGRSIFRRHSQARVLPSHVQRLLATYAHFMSSGVKIPHRLDVPVPVMQTAAAPTNPHHSTYFGTTPNHENKWDSRMDPKWCSSKIPLSLTPSQLIVKPDPSNSECKLPHSETDSDAAFVRDGSPCSHSIPQPTFHKKNKIEKIV